MDINKYTAYYSADKNRIIYLLDKVKQAGKSYNTVYTDFLTPEEAILLKKICNEEHLSLELSNHESDNERVIGAVFSEEKDGEYPYKIIKIHGNFKFEKLNHRDYLGAILSLGIKREKIGDINVFDDGAEVYVHNDICIYVIDNLSKIKHTGVKTSFIKDNEARIKHIDFKETKIIVTSFRLDCIVAALLNQSRTKAVAYIKDGAVKLNYSIEFETNKNVEIKDLVSIKGFGRYILEEKIGLTKSDRTTLLIKKYL
jgi:RNA-binding protein YlmH